MSDAALEHRPTSEGEMQNVPTASDVGDTELYMEDECIVPDSGPERQGDTQAIAFYAFPRLPDKIEWMDLVGNVSLPDLWGRREALYPSIVRIVTPEQTEAPDLVWCPSTEELDEYVKEVLDAARGEHFEDGMESSISRAILPLVEQYPDEMGEILNYWLGLEKVDPEVTAEALVWLGYMDHAPSHDWRRLLLQHCLATSSSVAVRDAAGVGLASMDDPRAIGAIRAAIERESCSELRRCLEQVLAQLEGNAAWRCS